MITGKFPSLRLRRTRKYTWSRRLIQENNLSSNDFIYPIFLIEGRNNKQAIKSMPDIYKYTIDKLGNLVSNAVKNKIPTVALFPSTPNKKKDYLGNEALNENNLVCRATRYIKKRFKDDIGIMCDVALDPYTSHGHDGLIRSNQIINDETVKVLINQSLLQAPWENLGNLSRESSTHATKRTRTAWENLGRNLGTLPENPADVPPREGEPLGRTLGEAWEP